MASSEQRKIGVVAERRQGSGAWASEIWQAVEILPGESEAQPGTLLGQGEGWSRFLMGVAELSLFRTDTESYKYNIESSSPSVFVILRPNEAGQGVDLVGATVCAAEATAHTESGNDTVEAVPMPQLIREWVEGFIAQHHVERETYKRKRDRVDTESMGRREPPAGRKGRFDD